MHWTAIAKTAAKNNWFRFGLLLAFFASSASAESFSVLGRTINFANPANYCTGGATVDEQQITRQTQESVGPNVKIVHWAVPCKEREEFRSGARQHFDHWIQIQVLGARGEFKPVSVLREQFLASVAKAKPRLDVAKLNKRISLAMKDQAARMENVSVEVIGRDGNAAYFAMRSQLQVGTSTRQIQGVGGMTLMNSVPLSVVAYEAVNDYKDSNHTQAAMRAILQSLLTEN